MKKLILFLSFLFVLSHNSYAQIQWNRYDFFQNSGGLNNGFSEIAIDDKEATDLQNVVFTTSGSFKTRDGFDNIASSVGAAVITTGIKYYAPTSGSRYLVAVFSDDKIRKMDYAVGGGLDGTWDDITGVLSFNATANNLASFAVGQDILLIEDGINTTAPYSWAGTGNAAALSGSPPNATVIAFHKNMAFAAGSSTNPSVLYFSDVGNVENWTTGLSGNVSIETNDGTRIRALVPGFDALYIFKDHSIWRLTGSDKDTFEVQRMIPDVGVLSPNAISLIGNEMFFVSDQGDVYIYDGATSLRIISTKIDGSLEDINFSRIPYSSTVIFNSDLWFSYANSSSSTNNTVLVYDTFNEAWTRFSGINANAFTVAEDGIGEDFLFFGDYGGNVLIYPDGTDDNGTAIQAYYVTKQFRFPDLSSTKDWKLFKLYAAQSGNYNIIVDLRNDFGSTGTTETVNLQGEGSLWGTAVYGTATYGGGNLITGRIEPNRTGDFFQIKFYNNTINQPFEVRGYQMFMEKSDRE